MKQHFIFAALAFAGASCFAQGAAPAACPVANSTDPSSPARQLIGSWKHVELARFQGLKKLSTQPFNGENVVRFDCDGKWSLKGPEFESSGTYRWTSADELEQKIVASKIASQRGQAAMKRIVVDSQRLEMHAEIGPREATRGLPGAKIIHPEDTVHAVSVFVRMANP